MVDERTEEPKDETPPPTDTPSSQADGHTDPPAAEPEAEGRDTSER